MSAWKQILENKTWAVSIFYNNGNMSFEAIYHSHIEALTRAIFLQIFSKFLNIYRVEVSINE
jgi:hypothetical protein